MSPPRFFVETRPEDAVVGSLITLSTSDSHHARRVLRLALSEEVVVITLPSNLLFRSRIVTLDEHVVVELLELLFRSQEKSFVSTVLCPLLKGSRNDELADWLTELGVKNIVFWQADRSVVRINKKDCASKLDRWTKIVEGAAKQSQQNSIPSVFLRENLREALAHRLPSELLTCLSLSESARAASIDYFQVAKRNAAHCAVVLGPEGDFSPEEEELLRISGATLISLGRQVLRAELAAVSGVTLLNGLYRVCVAPHDIA